MLKLPACLRRGGLKGKAGTREPEDWARQQEIEEEVKARYKQLVGGQVEGRTKSAGDNPENSRKARAAVERHRQRVLALRDEYNKLKLRADHKEALADELKLQVTLEANEGGLRAPMTDQELEVILAERRESHGGSHVTTHDAGSHVVATDRDVSTVAKFAGQLATHRANIKEASNRVENVEDVACREELRARLLQHEEIFETERLLTGTYETMAARLLKSKKEEAARNADLGDVMDSRQSQILRLKTELMLQEKVTKQTMSELRQKQQMLMGRRMAWEERRQSLLTLLGEAAAESNSGELRDAVDLRNEVFESRVAKLGIVLADLKPVEKLKMVVAPLPRVTKGAAAARMSSARSTSSTTSVKGGKNQRGARKSVQGSASRDSSARGSRSRDSSARGSIESSSQLALPSTEEKPADESREAAQPAVDGTRAGEEHPVEETPIFAEGKAGLAQYKRELARQQLERRTAAKLELDEQHEEDHEDPEEAEAEKIKMNDLLKVDREKRILAERERLKQERLKEIEAKALSNRMDPDMKNKLKGMGMSGDLNDQRTKMQKLFHLISRSLGMPEDTDAMTVAETIVNLAEEEKQRHREKEEDSKNEGAEGNEEEGLEMVLAAETSGPPVLAANIASAQLRSNCKEKEELLESKRKTFAQLKSEVQARLTAKAQEISGGGLASVKDVVTLEEKIESTTNHTDWMMTRVATSTKTGKNAALGLSDLYARLRKGGRVWRAVDILGKKSRSSSSLALDEVKPASRPASRLSQGSVSAHRKTHTTDDDWDLDHDPYHDVHPGPPLRLGEGDTAADECAMSEVNAERIDDIAASLVAMVRAVKVEGAAKEKGRGSMKSIMSKALPAVGEEGVEAETTAVSEEEDAEAAAQSSNHSSVKGNDSPTGKGSCDDAEDRENGKNDEQPRGGVKSLKNTVGRLKNLKKVSAIGMLSSSRKQRLAPKFEGMEMKFVESSSSSDDDDVQAGGRALAHIASDDEDEPRQSYLKGEPRTSAGMGRPSQGKKKRVSMMERANRARESSTSADLEVKPRARRSKPPEPSKKPETSAPSSSSTASKARSSSNNVNASSMPKVSQPSPASSRTSIHSVNKSKDKSKGEVKSMSGGKDIYSGKVKKHPEYPAGFEDAAPHSGSRSFSVDRPLPV